MEHYEVIFRKTIRTRNGRILVAAQYGLDAFPIKVKVAKPSEGEQKKAD